MISIFTEGRRALTQQFKDLMYTLQSDRKIEQSSLVETHLRRISEDRIMLQVL